LPFVENWIGSIAPMGHMATPVVEFLTRARTKSSEHRPLVRKKIIIVYFFFSFDIISLDGSSAP